MTLFFWFFYFCGSCFAAFFRLFFHSFFRTWVFHLRFLTEASFHVVCQLAFFSRWYTWCMWTSYLWPCVLFLFYSSWGRLAKPFATFPPLPKDRLLGFRCLCSNALHASFSDEPHLLFSILETASRIYSCTWSLVLSCFHCCFGFHKQIPKSLYRSKSLEK